jgi:hypothetical protein
MDSTLPLLKELTGGLIGRLLDAFSRCGHGLRRRSEINVGYVDLLTNEAGCFLRTNRSAILSLHTMFKESRT